MERNQLMGRVTPIANVRSERTMDNDKIAFYMHAGSGNHGCEAIVHTTCKMLAAPVTLMSKSREEDERYSLGNLCTIVQEQKITDKPFLHAWYLTRKLLLGDAESYMRYRYAGIRGSGACALNVSIGGDNYCYAGMVQELILANRMFRKQGSKTALWGCSIEPELLEREDVRQDMSGYDFIVARESLTYEALCLAGVGGKAKLYPDPAFSLEAVYAPLPQGWKEGAMVGINVSPLIMENEGTKGITYENYRELIRYILEGSHRNVALIPHVVWENNDDRKPLSKLYEEFSHTGRVIMVEDCGCMELKGYIARCSLFVGARTHASIAAYSTAVPTLVVGYSVKSRGIARDIFGSEDAWVLPVQKLREKRDLTEDFRKLEESREEIRRYLTGKMPEYIGRSLEAGRYLEALAHDPKVVEH